MNLFQLGDFTLTSEKKSKYKIECDALTDMDWETIAYLLSLRLPPFGRVEGVPRGGLKLAQELCFYISGGSSDLLIADDIYTTGGSMNRQRAGRDAIGAIFIARGPVAGWVIPLLVMTPEV